MKDRIYNAIHVNRWVVSGLIFYYADVPFVSRESARTLLKELEAEGLLHTTSRGKSTTMYRRRTPVELVNHRKERG